MLTGRSFSISSLSITEQSEVTPYVLLSITEQSEVTPYVLDGEVEYWIDHYYTIDPIDEQRRCRNRVNETC